jgi:DNA-binding GntR family transcriptional regulator
MIDRLAQCLPDQLRAIETADLAAYFLADNRFHRLIYEASGNSYLRELFESITLHMLPVPYSSRVLTSTPYQTSVYVAHQEVVEGLANRDQARVETALTRHSDIIMAHVKEQIRAETERKELVRRIKKQSQPSPTPLKTHRSRAVAEQGPGAKDKIEPFGKRKARAIEVNRK